MKLASFSVRNSLLVNLLCILVTAAGLIAYSRMNREAFPRVEFDIVIVSAVFPGAPPLEVEKLVTVPIEKELRKVSGIDEMTSVSRENVSAITLKLSPDILDKSKVVDDIQRAVDRVQDLPEEMEDDPLVFEITTDETPVVLVSLSGPLTMHDLHEQAELLEDRILDIRGVASVERQGWRDREIWVEVDPVKMEENHVALEEVMDALARKNVNLPAGKTTQKAFEYNIRTTAEFSTPEEIENVIIRANDAGNWLRVKEIAVVRDTFEDEETIDKTFGEHAIRLLVIKRSSGDIIDVVNEVKRVAEEFKMHAHDELQITYIDDLSFYVTRRLKVLKNNGLIGFLLVTISLILLLSRPVAIFTALGIPIALLTTFAFMAFLGITINLISMFGLIIVLGMLVDDGIIIAENIFRHVEEGMSPRQAAINGASEVYRPVTATILTTIAAFSPLLFMPGIMGKFVSGIPKVVIIALIASIMEAFIILPSHMADFVRLPKRRRAANGENRWFTAFRALYLKTLSAAIRRRYLFALSFVLALFFSLYLAFGVMKFILFPAKAIEQFFIRAEAPIGTSLERMETLVEPLEKIVGALPAEELDSFTTSIGSIQSEPNDPYSRNGSHLAQITVYLTPPREREREAQEIIEELREKSATIEGLERLYFERVRAGPPTGKAIQVTVRGEDYQVMETIADEFKTFLHTINGATYASPFAKLLWKLGIGEEQKNRLQQIKGAQDIVDNHEPGKGEIRVIIDENAVTKALLTPGDVARSVRNAFEGGIATTIKPTKAEEEIDVVVRFAERYRDSMEAFDKLLIPNVRNNLVPLSMVARVEKHPGVSEIRHLDGKRALTIMGDVNEEVVTSQKINAELSRRFDDIPTRHPGYSVKYGGEEEETQESMQSLSQSFLLALLLIFIILATTFRSLLQPFVVLLSIPFGLIGIVLAFMLHGEPFSFMALLGAVGLTGVVVNDSIVLVSFINDLRVGGCARNESLIEAGKIRFRPVLLTTVTTVGGLIPLAYGIGGGDPFLAPAALAIAWGLAFATVLTLLFIPCVYAIMDDIAIRILHRPTIARAMKRVRESGNEQETRD